jgi:hypothetical protein
MTTGLAAATANSFFEAICNNSSYAIAQLYCKLHVGDPGAAGTSNPAVETARQSVSFGAAAGGAISNGSAFGIPSVQPVVTSSAAELSPPTATPLATRTLSRLVTLISA